MQGRMGQFQYSKHSGTWPHNDKWKGIITSGDALWRSILLNSVLYVMPKAEQKLLTMISSDIVTHIPHGYPVVDLGSGGEHAIRDKLIPIVKAIKASRVILVDGSECLLCESKDVLNELIDVPIHCISDDFIDGSASKYVDCPAIVTYTGITIGNIVADHLSPNPPRRELVDHISRICKISNNGYALITFDSSLDENLNTASYEEHIPFHLNFLDQAVIEAGFPMNVRKGIVYRAIPRTWNNTLGKPVAGLVSHYAEFTEDVSFLFDGEQFEFKTGTTLLLKNSFKYSLDFFTECSESAGAAIIMPEWEVNHITGLLLKATNNN